MGSVNRRVFFYECKVYLRIKAYNYRPFYSPHGQNLIPRALILWLKDGHLWIKIQKYITKRRNRQSILIKRILKLYKILPNNILCLKFIILSIY